jgi:hypothetical protein
MTTPLVYIMFKIGMENKQYGINFEIASPKFSSCLLFLVFTFITIQEHGSLNN